MTPSYHAEVCTWYDLKSALDGKNFGLVHVYKIFQIGFESRINSTDKLIWVAIGFQNWLRGKHSWLKHAIVLYVFMLANKSFQSLLNLQSYSPEDNRFDLRQFLYNARWSYQFRKIDELIGELDVKDVQESLVHEIVAAASDGVGGMGVAAAGSGNPNVGL